MSSNSIENTVQPHKSLVQADWGAAVDSVYSIPACKGVELAAGATAGLLEIHLIDDAASKWYLLPLSATDCKGRLFNKIRTTNTTVSLAAVTCFPL
jgi:DNA-binding helix-hairpin-helix protein with protein kinase domain